MRPSSPATPSSHRQSITLSVVCLLILGMIFLLTVAGDFQTEKRLQSQLTEVSRLKEQREILAPLVAELQKNESSSPTKEGELTDSAVAKAPADEYEATLRRLIRQCDLKEASITPDVYSVLSNTGNIRVILIAQGAFSNFRRLILQLGNLSYLSGIEKFRIQRQADGAELELLLQLTLQLESAGKAHEEAQ